MRWATRAVHCWPGCLATLAWVPAGPRQVPWEVTSERYGRKVLQKGTARYYMGAPPGAPRCCTAPKRRAAAAASPRRAPPPPPTAAPRAPAGGHRRPVRYHGSLSCSARCGGAAFLPFQCFGRPRLLAFKKTVPLFGSSPRLLFSQPRGLNPPGAPRERPPAPTAQWAGSFSPSAALLPALRLRRLARDCPPRQPGPRCRRGPGTAAARGPGRGSRAARSAAL